TPHRWNASEDELLTCAVSTHGKPVDWKTVAQAVPGRTNKACRKRWLNSLSPILKKSTWTPAEDRLLIDLYTTNGPKWSIIAEKILRRTDDACSKRYREKLDPNLKKIEWTPGEDIKLKEAYDRIGSNWSSIGQALQRGGLDCRNRRVSAPQSTPCPLVNANTNGQMEEA
ncbi:Homeodomain-like protein, partial [Mycena olivaceomarginata]